MKNENKMLQATNSANYVPLGNWAICFSSRESPVKNRAQVMFYAKTEHASHSFDFFVLPYRNIFINHLGKYCRWFSEDAQL